MSSDFTPLPQKSPTRYVDTKLPLWGILLVVCSIVAYCFAMVGKIDRMAEDMAEVKQTLKASMVQDQATDQKILVLSWRLENLEAKAGISTPRK